MRNFTKTWDKGSFVFVFQGLEIVTSNVFYMEVHLDNKVWSKLKINLKGKFGNKKNFWNWQKLKPTCIISEGMAGCCITYHMACCLILIHEVWQAVLSINDE